MSVPTFLDRIWPAIFAFIGVLLSGWITWRYQYRQLILENKKKEYRELLDGLFHASEEIIEARPNIGTVNNEDMMTAVWKGSRIVQDRIFVARAIRAANPFGYCLP